ncbi:MAG: low molecular weight protein-tyrosine-phosphatase [Halieaceae bacterium]
MADSKVVRVLFVCLGNICRSPTAHGVFDAQVRAGNLQHRIVADSCGTGDWHVGSPPDSRAMATAAEHGYDLSDLRARQVCAQDFDRFDYILAMDEQNLIDLQRLKPKGFTGHLGLFLKFSGEADITEVPDPYYTGADGFTEVLQLVESASAGLLRAINDAD